MVGLYFFWFSGGCVPCGVSESGYGGAGLVRSIVESARTFVKPTLRGIFLF